jgi:hypothetical protein
MTPEERQILSALFDRMHDAAAQPRDRDAESFIADAVRQQPYAPYLLAQTVLVQEEALRAAAARIQELEQGSAPRQDPPSFLPGRAGSVPRTGPGTTAPQTPEPGPWNQGPGPWNQSAPPPAGSWGGGGGPGNAPAGGSFLRNAVSTAAGVAGGALLFQGIQYLFTGHGAGQGTGLFGTAQAAPSADTGFADKFVGTGKPDQAAADNSDLTEASYDDGDGDDDGFDDDVGFDDGGGDDSGWA